MAILRVGNPNRICLHHAGVAGVPANIPELKKRLAGYEVTHSKKTWAEKIKTPGEHGYHYLEYHTAIAGNGHELTLQDDKYVLYHAGDNVRGTESFNLHGVAVLIDGNYMNDQPNALQEEAFARYIARFEKKYGVNVLVRGHKETAVRQNSNGTFSYPEKTGVFYTSCPGTNLGDSKQGFLKRCIDRANVILRDNLPTNPLQDDVVPQEPTECEKEVERLKGENTALTEALAASQRDGKLAGERIKFLEDTLATREGELKVSEEELGRVRVERDRFEKEKELAISELNAYRSNWLVRLLKKLFS